MVAHCVLFSSVLNQSTIFMLEKKSKSLLERTHLAIPELTGLTVFMSSMDV